MIPALGLPLEAGQLYTSMSIHSPDDIQQLVEVLEALRVHGWLESWE